MFDVRTVVVPNPEGHAPALALKGDTVLVAVGDGRHVGWGEASHSGDDGACEAVIAALALTLPPDLSLASIAAARERWHACVRDRVAATAVSALDQALHELLALREGVPVWRLFGERPVRERVSLYATTNRALRERDTADHLRAVERAVAAGFRRIKFAPFHLVSDGGCDRGLTEPGLATARSVRQAFPELELRVDCHERFAIEPAAEVLAELDMLGLAWIEAPSPLGSHYADWRATIDSPLAAGELLFGVDAYRALAREDWIDVALPDVKHVGGLGALVVAAEAIEAGDVGVAAHNPSGLVSTLASAHAAAITGAISLVELALPPDGDPRYLDGLVEAGELQVPDAPGWGVDVAAAYAL